MSKVITLNSNDKLDLDFNSSEVITLIVDTDSPLINYNLSSGDYKILIFIKYSGDVSLNEVGTVKDSHVDITYVELNDHMYKQNTNVDVYKDSKVFVNSIYLGINKKHIDFDLVNKEKDSEVDIVNNVVCLDASDVVLNVVGTIVNGAKRSKCHQKNHCLTVDNPKQAKVLPVLKIDENDVEASHSLSSGTIDEEVLFYMNARGLTKKEALNLMVLSYLLPNREKFELFETGNELYELSERKVKELCLM